MLVIIIIYKRKTVFSIQESLSILEKFPVEKNNLKIL